MLELILLLTVGFFAGLLGGIQLIAEGHFVWGTLALLGSLLCGWLHYTLLISRKSISYTYSRRDCPHRGQRPIYKTFGRGYKWDMRSVGEEESSLARCTECGYMSSDFGRRVNPLSHIAHSGEINHGLPIHP